MSEQLDEEMKNELRSMSPANRAALRYWFMGHPHYTELVAFIDSLDAKASDE